MIKLFKCYQCWYVFDDELLYAGKHLSCSCGATHFRQVNPTFYHLAMYLLFHKGRALKRILEKERA
jgi:rubredoxin